jgi:hypothetical protein
MFFIIGFALNGSLLSLFSIYKSNPDYGLCNLMLKIAVAQMPVVAIAIGGMMLFQSTNR